MASGPSVALGVIYSGPQLQLKNDTDLFIKLFVFNQGKIIMDNILQVFLQMAIVQRGSIFKGKQPNTRFLTSDTETAVQTFNLER